MKVAIPVENDEGLAAPISEHFGKAPYFAIVTVKGEEAEIGLFENPAARDKKPGLVPEFLAAHGVKKVIARRIGNRAKILLNHLGIEVIEGVEGTLQGALERL